MAPQKFGSKERLAQSARFEEQYKSERKKAEKTLTEKVDRLRALRVAKEAADKEEAARAAILKAAVGRKR